MSGAKLIPGLCRETGMRRRGCPVKCNHASRRVSLEAVLGLIYGHQEWGVVVEIAAVMGLDPGPEKVLS